MENKKFLLKLAREAIETFAKTKKVISIPSKYPKELNQKRGIFVSIYKNPGKELRDCIGLPYPQKSIIEGVIEAAVFACKDPRFSPLTEEELKDIEIEISILTEPKLLQVKDPNEYLKKIKIGKDGLIINDPPFSGLLLPQVPTEFNWSVEEFLNNLCLKAGMPEGYWKYPSVKIYKFQAEIIK